MKARLKILNLFLFFAIASLLPINFVSAQMVDINWSQPVNLSNSVNTSTDPFLLADPAGVAHLFWAEKTGPAPGNQADTIMYTAWNGLVWTDPIDLFISPLSDGNPVATYPRAVIDNNGIIHLIWLSLPNFPNFSLNYSTVSAWEAGNATSWSPPVKLASDLTGQEYSLDIAYSSEQSIHIAYARGTGGVEGRGVSYIHSDDGGITWFTPKELFTASHPDRGASNVRIITEPPDRIYVTWTEWDQTGNGQAVYFVSSKDNGLTWIKPYPLAVRVGDDYERDYNNFTVIGPNQLVSIWEGGFRAYRGVMYSYDGGDTWTNPVDLFPSLIGDNGSVEFIHDSSGNTHVFIANRIREGYDYYGERQALWRSTYLGDERWSLPVVASVHGMDEAINSPTVTIINGNLVVAVWYGSQIYEIIAMTGKIEGAEKIPPIPWPIEPIATEKTPTLHIEEQNQIEITDVTPLPTNFSTVDPEIQNPGNAIYFSIIPPIIAIISVLFLRHRRSRIK